MDIKFTSAAFTAPAGAPLCLALPVQSGKTLLAGKSVLDTAVTAGIRQVLDNATIFKGDTDQFLWLHGLTGNAKNGKATPVSVLLYGVGAKDAMPANPDQLKLGGALFAQAKAHGIRQLNIVVPDGADAGLMALGATLRAYQFADYKTKGKDKLPPAVAALSFQVSDPKTAQKDWARHAATLAGVTLARDLMNQPPNICTPEGFAKTVKARMKGLPVTFKLMNKAAIAAAGMGAIQAVSRGSRHDAHVLIVEYNGTSPQKAGKKTSPLALVGKGVTFDTGGYNVKPGVSGAWTMGDMKYDMGGAAAVMGAVMALAQGGAKTHVVGIVGLTENLIDEDAYLPSEIVTTLSGQTVEVIDTDAEGRLVLADLLTHVQRVYKTTHIVDIATLTGSAVAALGSEYAAVLGNDDATVEAIMATGLATGEKCWRLPIDAAPANSVKGTISDLVNVELSRLAGASFAALFLSYFVGDDVRWAHIDMAGLMRHKTDSAICPAGAMGFGVRLLADYAMRSTAHG